MRGLQYQGGRRLPPGAPRYGYLIENNGAPVGPHQPRLGDLADTELAIYGM
jgi:hypothetical protein